MTGNRSLGTCWQAGSYSLDQQGQAWSPRGCTGGLHDKQIQAEHKISAKRYQQCGSRKQEKDSLHKDWRRAPGEVCLLRGWRFAQPMCHSQLQACGKCGVRLVAQVVEVGVKASLTPLLERAAPKGDAQIRSAALTVANQTKDRVVSTLLKEIALSYGYQLHLDLNGEGTSLSLFTVPS